MLEHLWSNAEVDVASTHAAVGVPRGITVNTVGSALERLFKKGLARREKLSHAFRYSAAIDRDQYAARRVVEAAGGLEELAGAGLLSAFVDIVADVDDDALARLEALVTEKRQRREGKP